MTPTHQALNAPRPANDVVPKLSKEARALEQAGKLVEAYACYQEILKVNPRIAQAHFQLGRLAYRMRRYEDAASNLDCAAKLKPDEAAVWELWSRAAARAGDQSRTQRIKRQLVDAPLPAPVKAACESILTEGRTVPGLGAVSPDQISAALEAMQSGDLRAAIDIASPIHARHPEVAPVALVLGSAYSGIGEFDRAEAAFKKAIESAPDYAEAHHGLGRMLLAHGHFGDGLAALEKAAVLAPGLRAAQVALARGLIQIGRDIPRATTILRQMLRKHPEAPDVLLELGRAYVAERKMRRAIETINSALDKGGERLGADPHLLLAQAYDDLGYPDRAHDALDQALETKPKCGAIHVARAALFGRQGRQDAARQAIMSGLDALPRHSELYRLYTQSQTMNAADPLLERMQDLYLESKLSDMDRSSLGFALAKAEADIGNDAKVFSYLHRSNALERTRYAYASRDYRKEARELVQSYRQSAFQTDLDPLPNAPILIAGLPRSGLSLVEWIIGQHPRATIGGELGFAQKEIGRMARGPDGRIRDWSKLKPIAFEAAREAIDARQRATYPDADIVTDRSAETHKLIGPILSALPGAKIVVVRRDPRDVALSLYKNKFPDGQCLYSYDLNDIAAYLQSFEAVLEFWRQKLPGAFHEVQFEQVLADPTGESRALVEACGLDWDPACDPSEGGILQHRPDRSNWMRYANDLSPLITALDEGGAPLVI